jgi:hypothetical protein
VHTGFLQPWPPSGLFGQFGYGSMTVMQVRKNQNL